MSRSDWQEPWPAGHLGGREAETEREQPGLPGRNSWVTRWAEPQQKCFAFMFIWIAKIKWHKNASYSGSPLTSHNLFKLTTILWKIPCLCFESFPELPGIIQPFNWVHKYYLLYMCTLWYSSWCCWADQRGRKRKSGPSRMMQLSSLFCTHSPGKASISLINPDKPH